MSTSTTAHGIAEDRYLSEPRLAAYLGYSSSTMKRLRARGLPCVGQGRLRRYHLPTVMQWLAEHA